MINFNSSKCQVFNNKGKYILKGIRPSNHYYKLIQFITCHKTTIDQIEIRPQKLGHFNYKLLTNS